MRLEPQNASRSTIPIGGCVNTRIADPTRTPSSGIDAPHMRARDEIARYRQGPICFAGIALQRRPARHGGARAYHAPPMGMVERDRFLRTPSAY